MDGALRNHPNRRIGVAFPLHARRIFIEPTATERYSRAMRLQHGNASLYRRGLLVAGEEGRFGGGDEFVPTSRDILRGELARNGEMTRRLPDSSRYDLVSASHV